MTNITQEDALSGKASMLKVLILLVCGDRGPRGQCRVKTLLNYYAPILDSLDQLDEKMMSLLLAS